jgi:outer membrane protein assembly factor BamB
MRVVALSCLLTVIVASCTSSTKSSGPAVSLPATASADANSPSATGSPTNSDWPMYHGDAQHTGLSRSFPTPTRLAIAAAIKLDAAMYGSPIVAQGITIVGTENDSVYAFDASSHQLWRTNLGSPSPARQRPCGNISPLGITGTPIYDAGTGSVYAVAEIGGSIRHDLVALDLRTGNVRWRKSVDLPGVDPTVMQQRGALAITGGRVWVPFGALAGDCGDYKGRIVGVRLDGSGDPVSYTPPTKRGGGMWNPAGATVDSRGRLLVVSANGAAFPGDDYDRTNSVLALSPDAQLVDSFAPSDWAQNNRGDVGLGSQGVALVGTTWAVLGGKSGPVYVLRQSALGGVGGQVTVKNICMSFGGAAVDGNVVYLPCTDGDRAVRVGSDGALTVLWHADEAIAGSPVIGGGRIWSLSFADGTLHALDPATGRSTMQVSVGELTRFATPALSGDRVLVPTMAGLIIVATH